MKKIIIAFFGLFLFFTTVQSAFAAVTWNTASNDCRSIAVANYTTNTGIVDPCWPLTSVNASPSNSINIRIYYHNTGNQPATNVRVILSAPTINNATNSHSFTGQIVSDQGSISFGPVYVNLNSAQKLSFGSTRWYANQTQSQSGFLYGQDGSELIANGLQIGTIEQGWSTQGSVVVSFYVNNPAPTGTLTASRSSCLISAGQSSCSVPFSWSTNNPVGTSSVTRDGGSTVGTGNSGSSSFTIPYNGATFRLYNNSIELDTESVTSNCAPEANWNGTTCSLPDCEISSFTANPTESSPGSLVVLSWVTKYCNYVNIANIPMGNNLPANGSKNIWPTNTATYVLTGIGGTSVSPTKSVQVTIGSPVGAPGFPAGAPGYAA